MIDIVPLRKASPEQVESLLDRAFGTDRVTRTAYRVRGAAPAIPELSFAAMENGDLVGSVQCWPVALSTARGVVPLVMVGPVAVDPQRQRDGLGKRLMHAALAAAAAEGRDDAMMLIGDPEYYGRFFGFTADATHDWVLPGPVERHRLLACGARVPAVAGSLGPAVPAVP